MNKNLFVGNLANECTDEDLRVNFSEAGKVVAVNIIKDKYNVKTFEKTKAVVAEFPYKSQLSIIAGVFKVYPEINTYVTENKLTMREIMEIYDKTAKKIYYVMAIK